jgi:leucyl aminopeptidase
LDNEYFELIKGKDSDFKNSSQERGAHPIVGGIFLKQFVEDVVPWAHIDIAGMATTREPKPYSPTTATGFGVRLIVEYIQGIGDV